MKLIAAILMLICLPTSAVVVQWDAAEQATGYAIIIRSETQRPKMFEISLATSAEVRLPEGKWFISVATKSDDGYSEASNEVFFEQFGAIHIGTLIIR